MGESVRPCGFRRAGICDVFEVGLLKGMKGVSGAASELRDNSDAAPAMSLSIRAHHALWSELFG
jgi:hypothetical protein